MYYRCELILNGQSYEATDDLRNWEDISIAYKRATMEGVVRSFASSFEFAGGTASVLRKAFIGGGLSNSINVIIYLQNNSWTWSELFRCEADISTVNITPYIVSFNCIDNSIQAKLKAAKNTTYEFQEAELADRTMTFERISMRNWEKFILATDSGDKDGQFLDVTTLYTDSYGIYMLPIYYTENSIPVPGAVELNDQGSSGNGFCIAKKNTSVNVRVFLSLLGGGLYTYGQAQIVLRHWSTIVHRYVEIARSSVQEIPNSTNMYIATIDYKGSVEMKAGDSLVLAIDVPRYQSEGLVNGKVPFTVVNQYDDETGCTLMVDWNDRGSSVTFPCFKPQAILQALLNKICGSGVTGTIESQGDTRLEKTMLAAADSIRELDKPMVYSSFKNFCNFMESAFGYIYKVGESSVTFMHRDRLFADGNAKSISEARDMEITVESSLLYSTVEIGNEAKDYNEENGLLEFNARQTYSTGNTLTSNTLTLSHDYRTDCYGIEYLVEKRAEKTKDDKSDKDVWAIIATDSGFDIVPDTTPAITPTGIHSPKGLFNALFHPRFCLLANASYIAALTSNGILTYASSQGCTEYFINGKKLAEDISIPGSRYSAFVISFETSDMTEPEGLDGKVSVDINGEHFSGWITKMEIHPTRQKSVSYTLSLDTTTIGNN